MIKPADTTSFPVVLFDGQQETNVGNITIDPNLEFKAFQNKLSQVVGTSYNNVTTYLVDTKKPKTSPDRRKILMTGKVNFAFIVKQRDCCFFVVLRRSRRDRRRRQERRFLGFNKFDDLVGHREEYVARVLRVGGFEFDMFLEVNFPKIQEVYPRRLSERDQDRSLCEECRAAERDGKRVEFHLCVYDEVVGGVGGFRSPVGPICRRM